MSSILFSNIFDIHQDESKNNKFIFKIGINEETHKSTNSSSSTLLNLPNVCIQPTYNLNNDCNPETNGEYSFFNSIQNKIKVIFDVGSRNDSQFTDYNQEVHYFEPDPNFYQQIKNKPNRNKLSYFNNFGLSNTNEYLWYYPLYQSFYNRILSCN